MDPNYPVGKMRERILFEPIKEFDYNDRFDKHTYAYLIHYLGERLKGLGFDVRYMRNVANLLYNGENIYCIVMKKYKYNPFSQDDFEVLLKKLDSNNVICLYAIYEENDNWVLRMNQGKHVDLPDFIGDGI